MKKRINSLLLLLIMVIASMQTAGAKDWFGNHKRFGGGAWGYNNDCNDWPEWTPMYWMEKMADNDKPECDDLRDAYFNRYRFQSAYPPRYPVQTYPAPYRPAYGISPYAPRAYPTPLARGIYPPRNLLSGYGFAPIPRLPASSFGYASPFRSPAGFASPFSSLGGLGYPGMSPMSSFSPASPMGGLGGFGSPVSPISPWSMGSPMGSSMGFPGMSPLSGGSFAAPWSSFGSSPFGGSGFRPFR